uniref:Uncharacterized protein n=1 Tax=Aegilops tauschii subsp. strangulata TaxID=200361 RepID=A0A453BK70_AEGTS
HLPGSNKSGCIPAPPQARMRSHRPIPSCNWSTDTDAQPPLHPLSRTLSLSRPPLGLMLSEPCLDLAGPWQLVSLENRLKFIVQENNLWSSKWVVKSMLNRPM